MGRWEEQAERVIPTPEITGLLRSTSERAPGQVQEVEDGIFETAVLPTRPCVRAKHIRRRDYRARLEALSLEVQPLRGRGGKR